MLCARSIGLLVCARPRYDHRTRIAAYVLNAVNDGDEGVSSLAMEALAVAGAEYERENEKDIIERRQ